MSAISKIEDWEEPLTDINSQKNMKITKQEEDTPLVNELGYSGRLWKWIKQKNAPSHNCLAVMSLITVISALVAIVLIVDCSKEPNLCSNGKALGIALTVPIAIITGTLTAVCSNN